jgi:hypothetical protein
MPEGYPRKDGPGKAMGTGRSGMPQHEHLWMRRIIPLVLGSWFRRAKDHHRFIAYAIFSVLRPTT